ncbi:MAG: hypothetical protein Q8Q02_09175 [Nocardioides sp.]|nr:hypothetical protein [Nocardioides sp.]
MNGAVVTADHSVEICTREGPATLLATAGRGGVTLLTLRLGGEVLAEVVVLHRVSEAGLYDLAERLATGTGPSGPPSSGGLRLVRGWFGFDRLRADLQRHDGSGHGRGGRHPRIVPAA